MDWIHWGYFGLFVASFLAATVLPITSEALLLSMVAYHYDPYYCLLIATIGNSAGSYLNYFIGMAGKPEWLSKIRVKPHQILKWEDRVKKHGVYLAFFAWLPFIGDVLSVALGFFRVNWKASFLYIFIGKFVRYLVILAFYYYVK
jgi:membrane protein YqaA with SNARE-associated domain